MAHQPSKFRFIMLNGVLGWGVTTGVLWAFFMALSNDEPFISYAVPAFFLFPIGGAFFGWFMWRVSSARAEAMSAGESVTAPKESALPLEVKTGPLRIIGWINVAFFLPCAWLSAVFAPGWPSVVFVFFAALGMFLLAFAGTIRIDTERVEYVCFMGRYAIRWSDVTHLETDAQGQSLVFYGRNCHLPIVGTGYWSGPQKSEFGAFLKAQLSQRDIPTKLNPRAVMRMPKNVRVKRAA